MAVEFQWDGPSIVARLKVRAHVGVRQVAQRVLDRAQEAAPVLTGRLRASGHLIEDLDRTRVYVVFDVNWAKPVHNGTARMLARPFLARAVLFEKADAFQTFQTIVGA